MMTTFLKKIDVAGIVLVAALAGACDNDSNGGGGVGGGGGGGGGNNPPPPVAPTDPIVYLTFADDTSIGISLELVDPATPGESVQINPPLVTDGQIGPFSLNPDRTHVAYAAFQDSATEGELYLVDLANPGTSVTLSGPLTSGALVQEFVFSPDGTQVAYIADQDVFDQFELYLVDVANPGVTTRLNPDLPLNGDVGSGISFSPDGTMVLYDADLDTEGQVELYLADVAAPGVATRVNPPLVSNGDVADDYAFSPDGTTIVYMADQDVADVRELYAVSVSSPGVATKLNPPLVADGDLCTFRISPDSTKVGYCADQDTDAMLELYVVELAVPGVSAKVNGPMIPAGDVQAATFRFGPASDFIVYRADQESDGDNELFRVDLATPGTSVKLNGALPPGGDVSIFKIYPDGLQLAYVADQDTEGLAELYSVEFATPGATTKLNPPRQGAPIEQIEIRDDGSEIFYIADQDTTELYELYRVDLANAGISTRISSAQTTDTDVFVFVIEPGFTYAQ